jgi:pimeloyl-ACP methyl ester carboxylesterase
MSRLIKVAGWTNELRASVVFVHGLGGHAYNTWRRGSDDQSFWPLWLAQDIEGIAVYALDYPAPASNWLGTAMPLQDRAVSVLECLLGEPSFRTNPVTFVCHSLGGLIVKQLMLDLQQPAGTKATSN